MELFCTVCLPGRWIPGQDDELRIQSVGMSVTNGFPKLKLTGMVVELRRSTLRCWFSLRGGMDVA